MRHLINKYGIYVVSAAFVLVVLSYFLTRTSAKAPRANSAFYVDEATGQESVHPAESIPPLVGKGGKPTVVEEIKMSFEGGKHPFVAYYRKFDLTAQAKINELQAAQDLNKGDELQQWIQQGELIRGAESGSPWVQANSPEGEKLIKDATSKDGQTATQVVPH